MTLTVSCRDMLVGDIRHCLICLTIRDMSLQYPPPVHSKYSSTMVKCEYLKRIHKAIQDVDLIPGPLCFGGGGGGGGC